MRKESVRMGKKFSQKLWKNCGKEGFGNANCLNYLEDLTNCTDFGHFL